MAAEKTSKLEGAERAAVFMMSLGEEAAAEVMRHMGPKEVQKIGTAMAAMDRISRSDVNAALHDFSTHVQEQTALGVGADEYVRSVMESALGDKASGLIDRILLGRNSKGIEALKWLDPRAIADMLRNEHPQIVAIVLSHLDADQASDTLKYLPSRVQSDILMRIATMDGVQPQALQELDDILDRQLSGNAASKTSMLGGVRSAANIMNLMEGSREAELMESIKESDADLGSRIEEEMFIFENLVEIDDRGIQTLLREIQTESLVLAMKGADDDLKDKIFRNMSKRAGEMLREDLEAKGPVRVSEVEAAQKEILTVARRLSENGDIVLGGGGSEAML
ncbi:flagellar motor switch protein FliG [Thioalkalivibrio sp. ALJ16]|uniref:flagellar motor switch protein FliG n=1 Tax=Thioalkalivibrio sp. ALJ16 TaxID=1158762 RepID=UPI000378E8BD|nr:flagellar motor switch protein FliG [Thioalkalivibrio sp. ALJ16]